MDPFRGNTNVQANPFDLSSLDLELGNAASKTFDGQYHVPPLLSYLKDKLWLLALVCLPK